MVKKCNIVTDSLKVYVYHYLQSMIMMGNAASPDEMCTNGSKVHMMTRVHKKSVTPFASVVGFEEIFGSMKKTKSRTNHESEVLREELMLFRQPFKFSIESWAFL